MAYWRTDMEQDDGRHIALFAESDAHGAIVQQFGLSLDGPFEDPELVQLVTFTDAVGRSISEISPDEMGWKPCAAEEYETAVEIKRAIYERDERLRRLQLTTCGKCGGSGRLVNAKITCPDCKGSRTLPAAP